MSAISAADVNKLRQMTGAGMMDCKKALTEAEGDFEKAIEILRKKGQKVSASRSDRDAKEGSVFVKTSDDKKEAVLIALNCETDFVGKNEEFQSLGKLIAETAFTNKPASKEALLALSVGDLTINDKIIELVGKIGEKIEVSEYIHMKGEAVVAYIHAGAKLGVLVSLKGVNGKDVTEAGKDVGMQIAAMNPVAVDESSVDKTVIAKELEIAKALILAEGKPENMVEKIAAGKLNKFFKESTLLPQTFVKDNTKTVAQYLDSVSKGLTVAEFKRVSIG
jgi:elongation factor Ts